MIRLKLLVKGVVQGVGFRPFVYKLANSLNLYGFVKNSSIGVEIELQGDKESINIFENTLLCSPPPLAKIDSIDKQLIKIKSCSNFKIVKSSLSNSKTTLISPDIKVCKECLADINNPNSRFFNYFGTNCTNCGPRYSIIKTLPYDRSNTSMAKFKMCKECEADYNNPNSRRYHAQPIACSKCGPKLGLRIKDLGFRDEKFSYELVANLINQGKIGAIKGVGGFHIVCDATNKEAIKKLRAYKNRPSKPFAIMCKNLEQIKSFAKVGAKEQELLESKEAPIVILQKKLNPKSLTLNPLIAPTIDRIGCMLPYTPLHFLLFKYLNNPVVATSANLSGEPIITEAKEIEEKLPFLDFVLDFNRDIINAIDDSVVQVVNSNIQILRLARGYAPKVIKLPKKIDKNILGVGANQKSTISIAYEENLILSPYIANLDSLKSIDYFKRTINTFKIFYDFKPDIIVTDLHPNYESTKIAQSLKTNKQELKTIQHHIAHLNTIKAEYNLSGEFISFIFDGTGLGKDNTLWGGEVFIGEKRAYYFKPIKLIGGEKAIKECKRVALSLLFEHYSLEEVLNLDLPTIKAFKPNEIKTFYLMWQKEINSPLSSSVGRLFDAVASLSGAIQEQTYEGEAGLLTELRVKREELRVSESFDYTIENSEIKIVWDFFDTNLITKFYTTLTKIILDLAKKENLPVILSGGVFQNRTLLEFITKELKIANIKYYYNKTIPINDSGISVGQVWSVI